MAKRTPTVAKRTPTVAKRTTTVAKRTPTEGKTTPTLAKAREAASGLVLAYGNFLTILINFMILAGAVFLLVKAVNTAKRKLESEKKPAGPHEPAADVKLLTEIRDLLKAR